RGMWVVRGPHRSHEASGNALHDETAIAPCDGPTARRSAEESHHGADDDRTRERARAAQHGVRRERGDRRADATRRRVLPRAPRRGAAPAGRARARVGRRASPRDGIVVPEPARPRARRDPPAPLAPPAARRAVVLPAAHASGLVPAAPRVASPRLPDAARDRRRALRARGDRARARRVRRRAGVLARRRAAARAAVIRLAAGFALAAALAA